MKLTARIILIVLIILCASLACVGGGGGGGGNAQATKSESAVQTMAAEHWHIQLTAQAGAVNR